MDCMNSKILLKLEAEWEIRPSPSLAANMPQNRYQK